MLIKDLLIRQKHSAKAAVIYGNQIISYSGIYDRVIAVSTALGAECRDCRSIGLFINNSIEYIIGYFAISYIDKVIVPINTRLKGNELISTIEYCELGLIITDSKSISLLRKYLEGYSFKIYVFNISSMNYEFLGGSKCLLLNNGKEVEFKGLTDIELNKEFKDNEFDDKELENVALLLHTSGSLSAPKRVMLTHENLISCVESIIESLGLKENDRTLISLPLFLASANTSQFLAHFYLGASIIIMDALFTFGYFFKLVERQKVTNFTGVPYMMLLLLDDRNRRGYDISSLRFICFGGAPTPAGKIKELISTYPTVSFIHMYGQTEASTRVSHLLPQDSTTKTGSVGKPIPGMTWKLVDDDGNEVSAGQAGEVIVKGSNVMKGYFKRQEQTREALKNGWLYTGDLGRMDDEGFMYIIGRKKNVIIKGGMNIYPEEIEEVLMQHPAVKEVCVIGAEDESLGEVPEARVVLNENYKDLKGDELINYCCLNLSSYKVPQRIHFVDGLTKTQTGKIVRS